VSTRLFVPRALRELRAASVYIARDNRPAAEALLVAALKAAQMLADRPQMGHVRPAFAPTRYRFWSLTAFAYLLVYDTETTPIQILRVVHTARDLPKALADLGS
jgi:plasmid stabilization system protein ParE